MEALGSPSISRDPMGRGPCFPKTSVCRFWHNDIHYRSLPEIHFTASGFFLKTFDCLCVFVFVSFWSFFFLRAYTLWKAGKKKQKHKNDNNLHDLQTGRTNTLLCRSFFRLSREKSIQSMCYQTRGPWWSYIAHLTKQICIFTVEVSAKFTALGFLYKLYSTNHPHPPPPPELLPITYKWIRLQLQLLCNFMITDYNYNYIFPECNRLQLHCNVIDYNYNYFLVVPCLKKIPV